MSARNQLAATAHNVYLLLYPKGAFKAALDEDRDLEGVVFLREIDTNDFMSAGRVYGGGLYKMEPKELGQISGDAIVEAMKERLVGAGMATELPFFG